MLREPTIIDLVVLSLVVFRLCRLVGWDDLTKPLRAKWLMSDRDYWRWSAIRDAMEEEGLDPYDTELRRLYIKEHNRRVTFNEIDADPLNPPDRWPSIKLAYAAQLTHCPWCLGFWLSVVVYLAWLVFPTCIISLGTILALSAICGLVAKNLDP